MSKYTRSNKINHYHDRSCSKETSSDKMLGSPSSDHRLALIGGSSSSSGHVDLSEADAESSSKPPLLLIRNHRTGGSRRIALLFCIASCMIVLLTLLSSTGVESLNCYHCSSEDNPACDEPFTGRANYTGETDCEKHIGRPAKVCRKIVQYIEDKKVVIRSCGFIDEHEGKEKKNMCYKRSGTFAIMMESCNCYEDLCNHSASLVPSKSILFSLVSVSSFGALLYFTIINSSKSHTN